MARIRSIKPEFWHDRKLVRQTSRDARMLYVGLWNHADEHARANGDEAVIKGQVFPYEPVDVEPLLDELESAGVVVRYEVDGDPFLFLPKLHKHQRLEPSKVASKFPEPPKTPPSPRKSARRADESEKTTDDHGSEPNTPSDLHTQIFSDESEKTCVESEKKVALHVAGSMEHVAGSMLSAPSAAQILPAEITSQTIVQAYVDGARSVGNPDPAGTLCARVGKQAKAMLTANDPLMLMRAAFNMGAGGWNDLAVQVQRDATAARSPGSNFDAHRQLIAQLEAGGQQ